MPSTNPHRQKLTIQERIKSAKSRVANIQKQKELQMIEIADKRFKK